MINVNIMLLYAQKAHIGLIGNIGYGNAGHQPGKKSQRNEQGPVEYVYLPENYLTFKSVIAC